MALVHGTDETDTDYVERVIQQEVAAMPHVTPSSLNKLRLRLLRTFHPDRYQNDTRYVDCILDKLSPRNRWRYMSAIPTIPTLSTIDVQHAVRKSVADALARTFGSDGATPSSTGDCVARTDSGRRRRRGVAKLVAPRSDQRARDQRRRREAAAPLDVDVHEAMMHSFVRLLIQDVFLPRGMQRATANLYGRHVRLVMSGEHALSAHLPRFAASGNRYVADMFAAWTTGFDAWSASVPSHDKRGSDTGLGHAALHAIYDMTEPAVQRLFDAALAAVAGDDDGKGTL